MIPDADPSAVRAVYIRQAQTWDRNRGRFGIEEAWLIRLTHRLPPGSAVLDLGCGAGDPVASWLVARGFDVTGVDFAPPMLALARARLPQARFVEGDMCTVRLDQTFDAILSWDAFFHLSPQAQRQTLPRITDHLAPGGRLLLTVGPKAGTATGHVGGEPVYHASLAPEEYCQILQDAGAPIERMALNDRASDFHSVLIARKTR